ncbi:hypothetical protein LJC68_06900 [Bacteroidales bacterium OttesenSCG-928-B11]|nr:hypothetical protein [Bacteroidales bacterium OttesenSCG-928-E04]MDL2308197.1 hypothetical protein [Bacteroidales bacterium OttesenSCG-928-C03]MDL2312589.1 hypothetical protein [Bacteroidales bacterium OttesenSCG-928-B11]MDL2325635.1 hypothetical protein [Bacteroidales bacterium OttesenSCG-928-A14]
MKNFILIFALIFGLTTISFAQQGKWIVELSSMCNAQQDSRIDTMENYWIYHNYIREAEIAFFIRNDIDSCLYYYGKAFDCFSYNFVNDLVNAAQIAYHSQKPYKPYLYKALRYGLKSWHLEQIALFKTTAIVSELRKFETTSEYKKIRASYVNTIDYDYLGWTYDLIINEMVSRRSDPENYKTHIQTLLIDFIEHVEKKGFPGSRLIGIDGKYAFSEIGKPELDLYNRVKKFEVLCEQYGGQKMCYGTNDKDLASTQVPLFLWHYDCSFYYLQDMIMREIGKGNLHPREMALWADVIYLERGHEEISPFCENATGEKGTFRMIWNCDRNYGEHACPDEQSDELRKKYAIPPLVVDQEKVKYEKKYGFRLFWGFFNCL